MSPKRDVNVGRVSSNLYHVMQTDGTEGTYEIGVKEEALMDDEL